MKKAGLIILLVLLVDQISKIYLKTHFFLGESVYIFGSDKAQIFFTENKGAAWGFQLNDFLTFLSENQAKIILSLFRIIAISGIGYWLFTSIKKQVSSIFIIAVSLIFAGAVGNIIDSVFYGVIFGESTSTHIATFLPESGGYASFFHGEVVDMFYFPFYRGENFTFFNAIFNVADFAISCGVGLLILFNKKAFPKEEVFAKEE